MTTLQAARRRAFMLAALLLAALGCLTVLALFARVGWLPELASHFRLQYLVLLGALGAGFLASRRHTLACAAALLALPNAWPVLPYLLPELVAPSQAAARSEQLSIVSLNLFFRNREYEQVSRYLRATHPDVLVLSELTPPWVAALRDLTGEYPHWVSVDRRSPWGLGVYSRYPLLDARTTNLGVAGSVNVVATVALPGGNVRLVAVHLASPTTPARAAARDRQLGKLAALLGPPRPAGETEPRLLVGDLNLTPFSPHFADLLARTGMVDARRSNGFFATWPTWVLPLQIPIDHCLADPSLAVVGVQRGPDVGSDHYPVEIVLRQRG